MLSPLIDCVFLLLVFFLVTSMFKRFEQQIPVRLASPATAVAPQLEDGTLTLGIDEAGTLFRLTRETDDGARVFAPVPDSERFFRSLADSGDRGDPVELLVARQTPFQEVIRVLDRLELLGFEAVSSRVRDGEL